MDVQFLNSKFWFFLKAGTPKSKRWNKVKSLVIIFMISQISKVPNACTNHLSMKKSKSVIILSDNYWCNPTDKTSCREDHTKELRDTGKSWLNHTE